MLITSETDSRWQERLNGGRLKNRIENVCICAVQSPFVYGGAEILVKTLRNELTSRNFRTEVINIPFKSHPILDVKKGCLLWRLIDLTDFNDLKIDLVIATKFPSYLVKHPNKVTWLFHQYRQAYELAGTEYSALREDDGKENREESSFRESLWQIDRKALLESKQIFTISKNVSNRLKKYNQIDSVPLYPPPKNHEKFYRGEFGNYVLSVGRLDPIKRVELLVEAMRHVVPEVKGIIVGRGREKDTLMKMVQKNDLSHRITFMDFVSDQELFDLYANALCVYFAPYDEDFGFITIESFLSGKPVITLLDSGGVLEFVKHEETGFVAKKEPEEIADFVNRLHYDRALCRRMGQQGYEMARKITWDKVIERLISE